MGIGVQVDASRTTRKLVPIDGPRGEARKAWLQLWRRLIFSAVQDAKRTMHGLPTDGAILARWWIAEHRPHRNDVSEWERSFDRACEELHVDAAVLRAKLSGQIDRSLAASYGRHAQAVIYVRRAMVLTCAGVPTAIARQYAMGLVDVKEYEQIAGIDHGDQYVMYDRVETVDLEASAA